MSKKGLDKLYDRLTPEERFRLDIEAHARGDERESRRLVDSCPIRNYNMTDWAFSGRWQTATQIVMAVCVDLSQHMSRLKMIDALRETLPYARIVYQNEASTAYMKGHEAGSHYTWERAGMDGDPPGWALLEEDEEGGEYEFDPAADEALEALEARLEEVDIMPELLNRLERKVTREAWTVWEAFASFTLEELELEPEKIVQVLFTPALAGVEDLKRRKERLGVESDEDPTGVREALSEAWGRYLQEAKRLSR